MILAKHFAIVSPEGKMFINQGSNTNGLYSSAGRAEAVLNKERKRFQNGRAYLEHRVVPIHIVTADEE